MANLVIMSLKKVVIIKERIAGREVLVRGTYILYKSDTKKPAEQSTPQFRTQRM